MADTTDSVLMISDGVKEATIVEESNTSQNSDCINIKKDWYQTDSNVVITLFVKNLRPEDLTVNIENQSVCCKISPSDRQSSVQLNLLHPICPNQSSWKLLSTKMEIKLKKQECFWWKTLEGEAEPTSPKQPMAAAVPLAEISNKESGSAYPSSCTQKRDWDRIAHEIQQDEATEKVEGESALNQLFQKIYSEGSDEVKKAMNKSFSESGGTVLSTNWKDVGNKRVEVNPPDGMEYKKWSA